MPRAITLQCRACLVDPLPHLARGTIIYFTVHTRSYNRVVNSYSLNIAPEELLYK